MIFALRRGSNVLILLALILVSAGMMLTAPVAGDFWWVDAPQHALNGAFVMDFFHDLPRHPTQWAMNYYIHYPALTILFYPPFFYLIEAGFFAVFGVSHFTAQLTVIFFLFLLSVGAYIFSRQWLPKVAALGVAILVIGSPEVTYWGRQVMLEIPTYAMAMFAMLAICAYIRRNSPTYLYLAVLFLLAALYTKFQIAYMVVPAATAVVMARGWRIVFDRHVIIAMIGGLLLTLPAAYLVYRFGHGNIVAATGIAGDTGVFSWKAWTAYPEFLPRQLGWVTMVCAAIGLFFAIAAAVDKNAPKPEAWFIGMLVAWVVSGYLFFSLLNLREPRHDLPLLFPIISLAAYGIMNLFRTNALRQGTVLAVALVTYGYSLVYAGPPIVTGYRDIVAYVAENTHEGDVIVFYGYHDGNFAFNLRAYSKRDLSVLRGTKLLISVAGERRRGVTDNDLDESKISQMLKDDGVSMIVAQRDFWTDIPSMARFEKLMHSPDYRLTHTFHTTGELWPPMDGQGIVDIFVPTYKVEPPKGGAIVIDLPIVGQKVTGQLKKDN